MRFDKNILSEIEYITLVLENCEEFVIECKYILDFWTSEVKKSDGQYDAIDDGGLIISKNAFHSLSDFSKHPYINDTNAHDNDPIKKFYFCRRITNYCNICSIYIKFKNREEELSFSVPYNPLENRLRGYEIDLSNCSSAELNENGDMLILFGKSSHAYKRIDNNYSDLIIGFKEKIDQQLKEPLEIKLDKLSNVDCYYRCPRLFIDMNITNKYYSGKYLSLVFEDVADLHYEIRFDNNVKRNLYMSRISTGEIFVEIENACTFYCRAVKTYLEYSKEGGNLSGYELDDSYWRLEEKEMESLPPKYFKAKDLNLSNFTINKKKVLNGDISIKYFIRWLQEYSKTIPLQPNEKCHPVMLIDRLQIRLSYFDKIEDCKELIEQSLLDFEENYKSFCKG